MLAFQSESEAIAYYEGIDVEDGVWLFFDQNGVPLQPVFTTPNKSGKITVGSGVYHLQSASSKHTTKLLEILPSVAAVEGELASVEDVRQLLTKSLHSKPR